MLMNGSIKRKVRELRVSHAKHVRAESGAAKALELYESAAQKKAWRSAAINNAYIQLCIDERDFERIDAFVEAYSEAQGAQDLPAFESVFEHLFKEFDSARLTNYRRRLTSLEQLSFNLEESDEWLLETDWVANADEAQHELGQLSALAQQIWFRERVQQGRAIEVIDSFTASLFEHYTDKRATALKQRNAKDLRRLADPIIDAYLKQLPDEEADLPKPERTALHVQDSHLDWMTFLAEAVGTSLSIRYANLLSRRNSKKCLEIYERRIRKTHGRSDHLINEWLVVATKHGRIDVVQCILAVLDEFPRPTESDRRDLPALVPLLKRAFKENEPGKLKELELLLPHVSEWQQQEYLHYKRKLINVATISATTNISEAAADRPQLLVQQDVAALVEMNRLDEAVGLLTSSLFQPTENTSVYKAKIKNLTVLSRSLRKPNLVFQKYIDSQVIAKIDSPENCDWSLLFALNGYYVGTTRDEDSKQLLEKTNFKQLPIAYAKTLLVWMAKHNSHQTVAEYFEQWHRREPSAELVAVSYATALHNNNQLEEACALLEGRIESAAHAQLALSLAALGRGEEAFLTLMNSVDSNHRQENYWVRLSGVCPPSKLSELSALWQEWSKFLEASLRNRITLQLAILDESLAVDWDRQVDVLRSDYSDRAAVRLMSAALAREANVAFRHAFDCFLEHAPCTETYFQAPYLQQVLRLLYRSNAKELAFRLKNNLSFSGYDLNFEMTKEFSLGNAVAALDARSEMVLEALNEEFDREFEPRQRGEKAIACPERVLAGELYSSFFFRAEVAIRGAFTVVCDERLLSIYRRTYPTIEFVPKTPRWKMASAREQFRGLPLKLANYLDSESFEACKGGQFFPVSVREAYPDSVRDGNRIEGWLVPDERLVLHWRRRLAEVHNGLLIGFSSSSTQRSPVRDHQIVELELWQSLYALSGVLFVNLNPALSAAELAEIGEQYSIKTFTPDFDLFNDFENLIALMVALDLAILPANSLMDFAASVGLRTFVFSPSGMMSNWTVPETGRYVFSDQVEFFCGGEDSLRVNLVERVALAIENEFLVREDSANGAGLVVDTSA